MNTQGGLEPLTKAGLSVHLETQREVSAAFNSLTLNDDNKSQIARHSAMSSLVHLCQSPDVECARHAIGAMANIAEDLSTHAIIGEKGGGAFLIGLMHHSNVDVHRCVINDYRPWPSQLCEQWCCHRSGLLLLLLIGGAERRHVRSQTC